MSEWRQEILIGDFFLCVAPAISFSLLYPAGLHDPCCFTAVLLADKKEADHFEAGFPSPGYPRQDALLRYLS